MKESYVYIITNYSKRSLYIGVTNDLNARLYEHELNIGNQSSWAGRYHCFYLIHFELFTDIETAIKREKELKGWRRSKKESLIAKRNKKWHFLNHLFPKRKR